MEGNEQKKRRSPVGALPPDSWSRLLTLAVCDFFLVCVVSSCVLSLQFVTGAWAGWVGRVGIPRTSI